MTRELRIGIFVGAAFLILAVFIFIVGDLGELFRKPGYSLSADFPNATGLDKRADVKMAGVKIGLVTDIRLNGRRALVVMDIDSGIQVPKDSKVTFAMAGLLGEKTVDIQPGPSAEFCKPGDLLAGEISLGFDQIGPLLQSVGDKIRTAGDALGQTLSPEMRANLSRTAEGLAALTAEVQELVRRNRDEVGQAVRGAGKAIEELDRSAREIGSSAKETIQLIRDIAAENRESLKLDLGRIKGLIDKLDESLRLMNSALEKINRGEGTLGKIIQDPALYTKADGILDDVRKTAGALSSLTATFDLETGYYPDSSKVRSAMAGGVHLGGGASLSAGLVRDPWRKTFTLSLQGGYRWGDLVTRAGFIESEFGVGMDYHAFGDRWVASVEGFDFNRADSPHLRASVRFFPLRSVFLMVGADDFTLAARRDVVLGMGLSWR
jgi:phospholipid/cholesterol/gamma-HCH transport system substrate-binding protein